MLSDLDSPVNLTIPTPASPVTTLMVNWPSSLAASVRVRRFRWPLILLLASIGLTAFAAFEAQRAVKSQDVLAERALKEYASFAVWSYAQHLNDTFNLLER